MEVYGMAAFDFVKSAPDLTFLSCTVILWSILIRSFQSSLEFSMEGSVYGENVPDGLLNCITDGSLRGYLRRSSFPSLGGSWASPALFYPPRSPPLSSGSAGLGKAQFRCCEGHPAQYL
jgi:hypothetical protein